MKINLDYPDKELKKLHVVFITSDDYLNFNNAQPSNDFLLLADEKRLNFKLEITPDFLSSSSFSSFFFLFD